MHTEITKGKDCWVSAANAGTQCFSAFRQARFIKLIKIKNNISFEKIDEYVDKVLKEKNLARDKRHDTIIKGLDKKLNLCVRCLIRLQ